MMGLYGLVGAVCVGLFAYLAYALLNAEDF